MPRKIISKFADGRKVFSVEFFPAKTEEGARQILRTAHSLKAYNPDFVSITYGAGGSTRERTIEYGELLRDLFDYEVMPHLTCVGHSKDDLVGILERFQKSDFHNIMTLRGDPPKGQTDFKPHPEGLAYASDLVAFIKERFPDFCLGVGGYPEKHPEASDLQADLANLKIKADAGADFITTQLFFRNELYFKFVDNCRALGIEIPVLPGVMPALSFDQVKRFCNFCGADVPRELLGKLELVKDDEVASQAVGVEWAFKQIRELLDKGAPGVHLYILNRSAAAVELMEKLRSANAL
ncbi:methylenetetrahydrofolate reductase [NAD(P)H] [Cerasicoccus fimbriatus]|uniref:methylenetetrahydrofolate reductase [NAD(P)H] n=1 Tax=Cerasicoccus fimbriatus TaxID=3014554 RepID=UPI0022B499FE|nr:methylenetetrahydrofolate reductase [NAD(P)H] [Cerasicoccus sp. TK19100]